MNYRAACPHCASVFRLGDDQLAAAAGWVQCGVCGAAFDARLSLCMEDGSALPVARAPEPVAPEPAAPEPPPTAEPATAALPAEAAEPADAPAEPADAEPAADAQSSADLPRGIREREDALDLPSIILIDPNLPSYDEPGPMPVIRVEDAKPPVAASATPSPTPPPAPPAAERPEPVARIEYAQPSAAAARVSVPTRRRASGLWIAAAILLLITLLAQLAWYLRDTLASRLPQTRPAFEQACALLGCRLALPRELDQLQIVGSDLQTEAGGRLRLVLTLGNRANTVQAWPVLVLTLTDQAGQPLARRSFAPSEYLDDPARIAAGMPPRSEQPLNLPLTVRDIVPMGFDLRLTY